MFVRASLLLAIAHAVIPDEDWGASLFFFQFLVFLPRCLS
jgi:hypothetical protein